jgi:hypothetical protein
VNSCPMKGAKVRGSALVASRTSTWAVSMFGMGCNEALAGRRFDLWQRAADADDLPIIHSIGPLQVRAGRLV